PPLLAALDIDDRDVRLDVLDVLEQRGDPQAVAFLWSLAGSAKQPEVREKANRVIARLLEVPPGKLPSPKVALTRAAERYYRHQVRFTDPERVTVWRWDGKDIVSGWPPKVPTIPASKAEEYWGLRFARQALEIDPEYRPAQEVFLSLALEKAMEPAG